MLVAHARNRRAARTDASLAAALAEVSAERLFGYVDMLAFPRHYVVERDANIRARDLLLRTLYGFGYSPVLQGAYHNILATSGSDGPYLLLGAHYDSVPGTPGADDNGSAVAACLECARLIKQHDVPNVMIVLFNREEDGLLGSQNFVQYLASE